MTIKITALLTSASVAVLYLFSLKYPNDPYFYFISSSAVIAAGRVVIAAVMLYLAMQSRFNFIFSHLLFGAAAAILLAFGAAGLAWPSLDYTLFNYLKPLDFMFMLEAGVFFALAAISFERGTRHLPRLSRPRSFQLRLFARGPA